MAKALSGINVLEFHSNLGAAYAAMLLAEQGADTIMVEPPGGAPSRGTPHFHVLNRSKRSMCLDLASNDGKWSMAALVKSADVVITGSTPMRLAARGLDYASIRKNNPHALVLNIPALGSRGPEAEFDASDDLVAARAGIAGSQWARSGSPVPLAFPAAGYSAGVLGASAVVAGLIAREHTGEGQEIEVSLLAGALSLQTGGVLKHEKMTTLYHGPQDPLGPIPCYRLFEASDHKFLFVACGNATFWGKFVLAVGLPELVSDPSLRKRAVGHRYRTLAIAQGHPRTGDSHQAARRMAQDSARGRRAVRAGHDAPGVHRISADRRDRHAPGSARSGPWRYGAARSSRHARRDAG